MMGSHLAERLLGEDVQLIATFHQPTIDMETVDPGVAFEELDVLDREAVFALIEQRKPQEIYHLAAQSLPTVSWTDPWRTLRVNGEGTVNIFEAILHARKADASYHPMTVIACSSAEYGASLLPERVPISEDAPLLPLHPYGVSKVAQDLLGHQYHYNHQLRCIRARIFNCTGPRKRNDVASDFARGIVRALNTGGTLQHGNLETERAIIDVRDMVDALISLARQGAAGEAYNVCADRAYRMSELLDMYFELAGQRVATEVNPSLLRFSDEPIIFGDTTKIRADTSWRPRIELKQTLADMLDFEARQFADGAA